MRLHHIFLNLIHLLRMWNPFTKYFTICDFPWTPHSKAMSTSFAPLEHAAEAPWARRSLSKQHWQLITNDRWQLKITTTTHLSSPTLFPLYLYISYYFYSYKYINKDIYKYKKLSINNIQTICLVALATYHRGVAVHSFVTVICHL